MALENLVDALIVGAGPAGLSTALALCRQRRTIVLFDSSVYRNAIAPEMHNFTTWDHEPPAKYRGAALKELLHSRYNTVQYAPVRITNVLQNKDGSFSAFDSTGKLWNGKKLVLATGVTDIMPNIPGFEETWRNSNIHQCLFCDGYEYLEAESAAVIAVDNMASPMSAHFAKMCSPFAKNVVIYTNNSTSVEETLAPLVKSMTNVRVDNRQIKRLIPGTKEQSPGIELDGGDVVQHVFFAHQPRVSLNTQMCENMEIKASEDGKMLLTTPPFFETSVKGCFAPGDVGTMLRTVSGAVAAGTACAGGIVAQL